MSDEDKYAINRKHLLFVGLHISEQRTGDLFVVSLNFLDDGVPDELDFIVLEGAFLHNLAGTELVSAVDDIDLRRILCQEYPFLKGGIASTDNDEALVLEKESVAGGAVGDTTSAVSFFAGDVQCPWGGTGTNDNRFSEVFLIIGLQVERVAIKIHLRHHVKFYLGPKTLCLFLHP